MKHIHVLGSLMNAQIPLVIRALKSSGYATSNCAFVASPASSVALRNYDASYGRTFLDAMTGYAGPQEAEHDERFLERADAAVLVLPAGPTAYLELGYLSGLGKRTFVLASEPLGPDWGAIYAIATGGIRKNIQDLVNLVNMHFPKG